MAEDYHIPVLKDEVISGLNLDGKSLFVDGTLGGAGHTIEVLKTYKNVKVLGFDRDAEAIEYSKKKLQDFNGRIEFYNQNFKEIPQTLTKLGKKADAILLDLGVSSHQLDDQSRGFSFRFDSALDMRMTQNQGLSAYDVVNGYSETALADCIYNYGEERLSRQIASDIIKQRPVETTFQLKQIIENCVARYNKREVKSSIQRVFQAIRIEVNGELDGLYELLINLASVTNKFGRIAVITFHSLEDRIVKNAFKELSTNCICPPNIPVCVCGHKAVAKIINKKPIIASKEELTKNTRSSSAKLRIIEIL